MTLYKAQAMHTDSITKTVHRILSSRGADWTEKQKDLLRDRIKAKQAKAKNVHIYQEK